MKENLLAGDRTEMFDFLKYLNEYEKYKLHIKLGEVMNQVVIANSQ